MIDWSAVWESIVKNKRLFIYGLLAFVLVVAGLWVWQGVGNWWFKSRLEKEQQNVNALTNQAQNINVTIANLKQQEFEKQVEVNGALANLDQARKETDEAQEIANQALDNVNAARNGNFNGTSTDDANSARCRAFPNSADCRR
jgi:thiol:disulfide interchange protein